MGACVPQFDLEVRKQLQKLAPSFHHADPGGQTQVVSLDHKYPHLKSHFTTTISFLDKVYWRAHSAGWWAETDGGPPADL